MNSLGATLPVDIFISFEPGIADQFSVGDK